MGGNCVVFQLALAHIDVHCQSQQGATIVGVYFANESFVDSRFVVPDFQLLQSRLRLHILCNCELVFSLDSFVCRVAEKIVAQFPAAVIVQVNL